MGSHRRLVKNSCQRALATAQRWAGEVYHLILRKVNIVISRSTFNSLMELSMKTQCSRLVNVL